MTSLQERVEILETLARNQPTYSSPVDVEGVNKRLRSLESQDITPQLRQLKSDILKAVQNAITKSQRATLSAVVDTILSEDKSVIRQLQQELATTASAAFSHAKSATDIARIEIDAAVELLRAKSYVFAQGE